MAAQIHLVLLYSLLLLPEIVMSQNSCPPVGSEADQPVQMPPTTGHGLYLNFGNPAQCSGTITAWRYCLYKPPSIDGQYVAKLVVYRRSSASDTYTPAPGSIKTLMLSSGDIPEGFSCGVLNLAAAEQFQIEQNDIVGACLPTNGRGLPLVSMGGSTTEVYLSELDDCGDNAIMGTNSGSFTIRDMSILHLNAQITPDVVLNECRVGNNPKPSWPQPLGKGPYLNIQHTSPCSGNITSWKFCYYGSGSRMYRATFGIWRRNTNNEYVLVEGSEESVSLVHSEGSPNPNITCTERQISPFPILFGDVLGVSLVGMLSRRLPILSSGEDGSQLLNLNTNQIRNFSLHVYAVITSNESSVDMTSGRVAAVVVVILVMVLAIVVAVVVLIAIWWRRRKYRVVLKKDSSHPNGKVSIADDNYENVDTVGDTSVSHYKSTIPIEMTRPPPVKRETVKKEELPKMITQEQQSNEYAELTNIRVGVSEVEYADLLEKNIQEDIYSSVDHYKDPASDQNALYDQLKGLGIKNIKRNSIKTLNHLGSGQFGSVDLGEWEDGAKIVDVALKTLNEGSSKQDTVKFLQEAAIMAQFRHPNVIKLYGVISTGEPIVLVVELADRDLLDHLSHLKGSLKGKVTEVTVSLLKFSQHVGLGMQYLSAKGFVHRDLASRNILVKRGRICKIADFGMSRDLAEEEIYVSSGGKIPLKWTAPEAVFFKTYSTASDVWSYGCVLYEIWSLGHKPFGFESNSKVIKLVRSGFRLPPPPGCPRVLYEAMIQTWNPDAELRPNFREVVLKLVSSRQEVLMVPREDLGTHPQAGTLGADLDAGLMMYKDLQERYRNSTS